MTNFANGNGKFCKRRISQIANLASGKYNINSILQMANFDCCEVANGDF